MRPKAALTVLVALALVVLWVPAASAKARWSYGNGQSDIAPGAVCTTSVTGLAGEGTSVDPNVTPPPPPSSSGFTVELYVAPNNQPLDGGTFVAGGLKLPDDSVIPPLKTTTTEPPQAIDPFDNVYYDFQDNPIWEYSAAPFAFTLDAASPVFANVAVHLVGRSAYYTGVVADCTTTSVTASPNPSSSGESVTFTATVKSETNAAVTQGGVQFVIDGVTVAANVPLNASGQAVYSASWLAPGSHDVEANYLGASSYPSSLFGASTASVVQKVVSTDSTPPTFGKCTGGPFLFRTGGKAVSITARDGAGGSGIDASASTLTGTVATRTAGVKRVTFTAVDNAGNTATKTCRYHVNYVFTGFSAPVDNGLLNVAKAGLTVPFRFTVTDGKGQPVTDLTGASRSSVARACPALTADAIEEYTAGPVGLVNLGGGAYQLNVATATSWAGTCRTVTVTLADGLPHPAEFKFRL